MPYTFAPGKLTTSNDIAHTSSRAIRLLIVDDVAAVRSALSMFLMAQPEFEVVGEACNAHAALELAATLHPDVVIMDVEMPGMDGITATRTLHLRQPAVAVILLTVHGDELTRDRAQEAGAAAFISKSMHPRTLLAAIRQIARPQENAPSPLQH
jgi:two-component system, NarL family, response regulator LiaR